MDSQIEGFAFLEPVPKEKQRICSQVLDAKAVGSLTRAVRNHFWFELFLDDLPIWGFVGPPPPRRSEEEGADDDDEDDDGNKGDPSSPYPHVYTHRAFDISYNAAADRIIQVNLTSENPQPLVQGQELTFTYEVRWSLDDSGTPFSRRFEKYLDKDFFQHRVHWWALANAAATVTFLMVLVAAILLRTLRADVARYNSSNNGATAASLAASKALGGGGGSSSSPSRLDFDLDDFDDESGWKVLSGDVFRSPNRLPLLSALVGTGAQLCLLAFLTSAAAALGSLFEERGSVTTFAVVFYALTSVVGGYVAGETFSRCSSAGGGKAKAQARTWLLTATLLPLSTFAVGGCVNAVALFHRSLAAVPLRGVAGVLALWLLLSAPLCRLGFALGRRRWQRKLSAAATNAGDPARTKRVPSPIPAKPWHRSRASVCLLAGVLPFLSILVVSSEKKSERMTPCFLSLFSFSRKERKKKKSAHFPVSPLVSTAASKTPRYRKCPSSSLRCGTTRSCTFTGPWFWPSDFYSRRRRSHRSSRFILCCAPRTTGGTGPASPPGSVPRSMSSAMPFGISSRARR